MTDDIDDIDFETDIDLDELLGEIETSSKPKPKMTAPDPGVGGGGEDDDEWDFLEESGLSLQARVTGQGDLTKSWMKYHHFTLVKTVAQLAKVVDDALAHGRCALDLETQGFDNRIEFDKDDKPYTRHKIVGYCLSIKGHGYYVPILHEYDKTYNEKNPNVDPVLAGKEITRLCRAAQPVLTAEAQAEGDFAGKVETPGKVVVYFWHAKFDHEFLYPITGIDAWHPDSFEDGMLAAYAYYSDDKNLSLKAKSKMRLSITDPEDKGADGTPIIHPYEMIKFAELFPKGTKKGKMQFAELYPEEGSPVMLYGCSDGICTELLCEMKRTKWEHTKEGLITKYEEVVGPTKADRDLWRTYHKIEKQTTAATREMERPRAKIDLEETSKLLEEAKHEYDKYDSKICELAKSKGFHSFNPSSTQQLSDFLFGVKGLNISPKPEKNESSGQYKTDAATLEAMAEINTEIKVLGWIVTYRQIEKVIGTYLTGFTANCDEKHQLRFNFKQTGAATGRYSAPKGEASHGFSGIPIHGIPARNDPKKPKVAHSQRRLFVSRPGYAFVKVDYAGQELRVVANIANEPVWIKEFLEGDGDLHTLTAVAFYPGLQRSDSDFKIKRTAGKIANFSLIYGGGVQAIMRATGCDKVEAARKLNAFHKSVPNFAAWTKQQHAYVKKRLGVYTGFRRFIRIPDANIKMGDYIHGKEVTEEKDVRRIRAACERKSTNYPIQGSGADILKISMIGLHKRLAHEGWLKSYGGDDSVRMIMTVHDEICFEIKYERLVEAMPIIIKIMESPSRLIKSWPVDLVVEPEFGLNWEAKHEWLKVLSGDKPIPEWLEGHVTPGAAAPKTPDKPKPPPASGGAPKSQPEPGEVDAVLDSEEVPVSETKSNGVHEVVTFTIPKSYVTLQLVPIMMGVVAGSVRVPDPKKGKLLRVLNNNGEALIDPTELRIRIDPDLFARKLRDHNLGRGQYQLTEEHP